MAQWMQQVVAALPIADDASAALDGAAMDVKTLRMSAQCGAIDAHLVSLFSQRYGVVLSEVAVADKSNEITASAEALAMLMLTGVVITGDAMFTQRRLRASTELVGYTDWPGLAQTLCMERRVTDRRTGESREEIAYAVTSLAAHRATPAHLLMLWRAHWHIENKLHWVRDVTFGEDPSTVRAGVGPQALVAVRNLAIGLLRLGGATNLAAACRRYAAQPAVALAAVGLPCQQ